MCINGVNIFYIWKTVMDNKIIKFYNNYFQVISIMLFE